MADHAYILQVLSGGLRVEVLFNGWPAYRKAVAERRIAEVQLNAWTLEGRDRLELYLAPLGEREPPGDAVLQLRLYKAELGRDKDESDVVVFYRWTPDESPLAAGPPSLVFSHDFTPREAFGRWAWEGAQRYLPSQRADVVGVAAAVHRAFAHRDAPTLLAMLRLKHEEWARAVGLDLDDRLARQQELFEHFFQAPDYALVPLDEQQLVVESSAGGRLVAITDAAGEEPIACVGGGGTYGLHLTVSNLGGSWQIVR